MYYFLILCKKKMLIKSNTYLNFIIKLFQCIHTHMLFFNIPSHLVLFLDPLYKNANIIKPDIFKFVQYNYKIVKLM